MADNPGQVIGDRIRQTFSGSVFSGSILVDLY